MYLPNFLVINFKLTTVDAGVKTAGFITLATALRPIGGWLGDKFNPLKILFFVFGGFTPSGILFSFSPTITLYTIGCLAVAICRELEIKLSHFFYRLNEALSIPQTFSQTFIKCS
jgi:NNP family nitrate/nitrite transporter-like MFS transporter